MKATCRALITAALNVLSAICLCGRTCYDIFWTEAHGFLVLKVKRNDVDFFLQPFGGKDEDLPLLMKEIKEYHNGKPFEIHGIFDDGRERLLKSVS